ncbi:hypothetical protein GL50803_0061043 [Giardia duodenalis]|uniref:Uncharacterized protein n=1 Tax=Giardia intestinalis (strain ATCC 50803 / WB clone C6) TaxID=184922 RepID=A0A644F2B5_GIAIC|nr:hypothetical protein GL50803_0061043 [Giardia intestinalis]KAE8302721.1 hypothetical protein GL50803_0061043 [Giardia intestinalis]
MSSHTTGCSYQDIYRISSSPGKNSSLERVLGRGRSRRETRLLSPDNVSLHTGSLKANRLVDRQIYSSINLAHRERRPLKSPSESSAWLRKPFGSLIPLWKALDIPPLERNYASIILSSHSEYLEVYTAKLKTLVELQRAYVELSQDRQKTVQLVRQIMAAGKGSKSVLICSLTKLKRLTIFISTLVNLARLICKKPVNLQPFGISSRSPKYNWLLYLRLEGLYSVENTALLFTIFCFKPGYTYKEHIQLVKEYFHETIHKDSDDQFVIKDDNQIVESVEDVSQNIQLSNYSSEEFGEAALNFLLGLQAETLFEHDCLAVNWDMFLHTKQGEFYGNRSLPYTLLSPEQILDAVKSEEQTLIEFSSVLSDIRLSGCNVVLVPVIPNDSNIEIYVDKSTNIEDDNILLAEATARQAKVSAPRIISLSATGLEPTARLAVPPCSIRESKDVSMDKDKEENEAADHMGQTFADQSTLTTLVTALEMTERETTLTLDSSTN